MMRVLGLLTICACASCLLDPVLGSDFEADTLATARGEAKITCIGHGTLMFEFAAKVIHVDPVSRYADSHPAAAVATS